MDINEIKKYDDIVTAYKLNPLIATNKSKGIWSGQQIPSDHLFQSWEQFACKRLANTQFGMRWEELEDWGPKECRAFYNDRLMEGGTLPKEYQLNTSDKAIGNLISGAVNQYPEGERALSYRWNNGFAFKNYRMRIDFGLEAFVDSKASDVGNIVQEIKEAERIRDSFFGELDGIAGKRATPERVKHLISHWKSQVKVTDFLNEDPE